MARDGTISHDERPELLAILSGRIDGLVDRCVDQARGNGVDANLAVAEISRPATGNRGYECPSLGIESPILTWRLLAAARWPVGGKDARVVRHSTIDRRFEINVGCFPLKP